MTELKMPSFKKGYELVKYIQELMKKSCDEIFKDTYAKELGIHKEVLTISLVLELLLPLFDKEITVDDIWSKQANEFIKLVKESNYAKRYIEVQKESLEKTEKLKAALKATGEYENSSSQ